MAAAAADALSPRQTRRRHANDCVTLSAFWPIPPSHATDSHFHFSRRFFTPLPAASAARAAIANDCAIGRPLLIAIFALHYADTPPPASRRITPMAIAAGRRRHAASAITLSLISIFVRRSAASCR